MVSLRLIIILVLAVVSAGQRHGVCLEDTKVDFRRPDAAGSCQAEQAAPQHQVTAKQTEEERNEMIRQAVTGGTVQLRAAGPPLVPPTSTTTQHGMSTLEPLERWPLLRSKNRSNSSLLSMITLAHPDDHKIIDFGKRKGKMFRDVSETDKGYCTWVKSQDPSKMSNSLNNFKMFYDYLLLRGKRKAPQRLESSKEKQSRHEPLEWHVPLAFISESHLEDWHVFMVQMTWLKLPTDLHENPGSSDLLHRFVKKMVRTILFSLSCNLTCQ
jgi:hypothetical protein